MVEERIQELLRNRLNEQAVSIERVHFYKTDRSVNPKQESPFRYFPGSLPVLVSAPHAVRHVRQKKIKMSDEFTGSLAYLLNQLTDCHVLALTKVYGGDPNVDFPCIYKDELTRICRESKIKFILDLHGAARDHEFDADLGTNGRKSLLGKERILDEVVNTFKNGGLTRVSLDHFAASGQNTITAWSSRELGIPAIQAEINRKYRVPAQNPTAYCRLLAVLAEIIPLLARKSSR